MSDFSWQCGDWQIRILECGRLALDGGSMFGSVPRGLWERLIAPDDHHRIPLAMRLLWLENSRLEAKVLVDTGIGEKGDPKFRERFAVDQPPGVLERGLTSVGASIDEVTHVVLTHLHFDHGGGATKLSGDQLVPTFPQAQHFLQRRNFETASHPNPRERASYLPENVEPLREVSLELLEGEEEVIPGLTLTPSHGHTAGMQTVRIEGGGRVLYYPTDLAPTHHHVRTAFTMGYDLCSREIMTEKTALFGRAYDEEALVIFEHDPEVAGGSVVADDRGGYRFDKPIGSA